MPAPAGTSLILDVLSGSRRSARGLVGEVESLIGAKLGEVWIIRFLRETAGVLVLAALALAWLSTCLTAVPLGSRGVLVSFGTFDPKPLEPGLHVSWPWPFGEVVVVETERVRELALGFDRDLTGPLLWTERHYVGEQNLLVATVKAC